MKMEAGLVSFKTKIAKPCKKLLRIFKFRIRKKPFSIKSVWVRSSRSRSTKTITPTKAPKLARSTASRFLQKIGWLKTMDRLRELRSSNMIEMVDSSSSDDKEKLLISPLSSVAGARAERKMEINVMEDACKSFENYLMEMIIEEGKVRDLMDVEELLYCWKNLKCPVFVDLVSRFYGELCKDLFSSDN